MRLICRIGWHAWGQWVEDKVVQHFSRSEETMPVGYSYIQSRECKSCGRKAYLTFQVSR